MNMNRLFIGLLTAIIVLLPCREISAKQKKRSEGSSRPGSLV